MEDNKANPVETDQYCELGSYALNGTNLASLMIDGEERVCLAQLSNTLLKDYSYNEIHNRRVALGITCVQCSPLQLEVLRRAGAMPPSSRRCGMITQREAERLCKSFFNEIAVPTLPSDFVFSVYHKCGWGCTGYFIPSRYNSSRAKCIQCGHCKSMLSPNKFIFHCHKTSGATYIHPDAANFNSWRRHIKLTSQGRSKEIEYAWEDVKSLFNGGSRKRIVRPSNSESHSKQNASSLTSSEENRMGSPIQPGAMAACSLAASPSFIDLPSHYSNILGRLMPGVPAAAPHHSSIWSPSGLLNGIWNRQNHLIAGLHHSVIPQINRSIIMEHTKNTLSQTMATPSLCLQQDLEMKREPRGGKIKRPWLDVEGNTTLNEISKKSKHE